MRRIIVVCILLIITGTSCKSYLDIKPYGKTIPKTSEEFAALLHTRLNEIDYGTDEVLLGNVATISDLECFTDNLDASLTNFPAGNVLPIYSGARINNQQSRYEKIYQRIRDCNIILNNFSSELTEDDRSVIGTAYAIRGISYYHLLRDYCEPFNANPALGVPLVADFDMEERPLRSSYAQTMDFIESDLTKALNYKVTKEIYRFTEDVVKAYLSRYYFWTNQWDKAIVPATELLTKYPLLEGNSYKSMMQAVNSKQGNVLIRSFRFSEQSSNVTYNSVKEIIKARPLSKEMDDLFTDGDNDIRRTFFFTKKRETTKNMMANVRTDEMCLILAEAYAHKNDAEKALLYLNQLRGKRIGNYVNYTGNNLPVVNTANLIKTDAQNKFISPLMQAILNERRKELFAEGDRWYELKRNGRPEFWVSNDGRKFVTQKYLYTFPLPRVDVELISGLVQNTGYQY